MNSVQYFNQLSVRAREIKNKVDSGEGINAQELAVLHELASLSGRPNDLLSYANGKNALVTDEDPAETNGGKSQDDDKKPEEKFIDKFNASRDKEEALNMLRKQVDEAYKKAGRTGHVNDQLAYINLKQELDEATTQTSEE